MRTSVFLSRGDPDDDRAGPGLIPRTFRGRIEITGFRPSPLGNLIGSGTGKTQRRKAGFRTRARSRGGNATPSEKWPRFPLLGIEGADRIISGLTPAERSG